MHREIVLVLAISRNTVSKCISLARGKGISLSVSEKIANHEIEAILFPDEEWKQISQSYTTSGVYHLAEEMKNHMLRRSCCGRKYINSCRGIRYKA